MKNRFTPRTSFRGLFQETTSDFILQWFACLGLAFFFNQLFAKFSCFFVAIEVLQCDPFVFISITWNQFLVILRKQRPEPKGLGHSLCEMYNERNERTTTTDCVEMDSQGQAIPGIHCDDGVKFDPFRYIPYQVHLEWVALLVFKWTRIRIFVWLLAIKLPDQLSTGPVDIPYCVWFILRLFFIPTASHVSLLLWGLVEIRSAPISSKMLSFLSGVTETQEVTVLVSIDCGIPRSCIWSTTMASTGKPYKFLLILDVTELKILQEKNRRGHGAQKNWQLLPAHLLSSSPDGQFQGK